jgi:hypothetical protein
MQEESGALIHSHFAQLNCRTKNFVLMNNGCMSGSVDKIWTPTSIFPNIEDDVLLYLLLMGGKDFAAFRMDGQQVPYAHFLLEVKGDPDCRSYILDQSNAVHSSNNGMFLESLLCATVCVSSHANGIMGIEFQQFLLNLVYNVQPENINMNQVTIKGLEIFNRMDVVPFLSPPNQEWPEYIGAIPGSNFGLLGRSPNSDKIDLWTSKGIYGESKDYGSEINLDTMKKILQRVPENARLELVFTRKLQKSYFNPPARPFQEEFSGTQALSRSYFKIDASRSNTLLEPINGLPHNYSFDKGIVIFFEINQHVKLK